MTRCPPRLAVALLERFVPDNGPLTRDLLEQWPERTSGWFWRQVLTAICTPTVASIRTNPRTTIDSTLVAIGVVALLGFCAMVAASLLHQVLVRSDVHRWSAPWHGGPWPFLFRTLSFAAAVVIGWTVSRFHGRHRIAVILACSASATAVAFIDLALFVPRLPNQPFFPDPVVQLAATTLFVIGLFAGTLSRSTCEPRSSS